MTDEELISKLDSDPSGGMRLLIDRYSALVRTIACGKLRQVLSYDDIEEYMGYIFAVVYRKRNDFDPARGSFKGYVSGIARQLCIDEYRRQRSRICTVPITDEMAECVSDGQSVEVDAESGIARAELAEALQKLGRADRNVLVMRYYYGMTSAKIGEELHITDAAVRKRVSRALEKLRGLLYDQER